MGRAADQRELRCHDQVRPVPGRLPDTSRYPVGVAGQIADNRVHLEE